MKEGATTMTEGLKLTVDRRAGLAVIYTDGYINNQGGEEIARTAYDLLDQGHKQLLLNPVSYTHLTLPTSDLV